MLSSAYLFCNYMISSIESDLLYCSAYVQSIALVLLRLYCSDEVDTLCIG
jgi:hypothetical protein